MGTPFKLKNGSVALSVEVPGGLYNSAHLKKLAALSEQHSMIIKATEDQRLALFVVPELVDTIAKELASGGLAVRDYQDGVHQPVACLGALCPESKQDALKASLDITEALAGMEGPAPLKVGINGCAACCVPCHTLDIAIVGSEDGYRISLGGKQMVVPELASFAGEAIPADELVDKVKAVVDVWKENAQPGERMQAVIERAGMAPFIKALAPYSGDAGGDADQVLDAVPATIAEPSSETAQPAIDSAPDEALMSESESSLESTMLASMDAEASVPTVADENASARDEILNSIPEAPSEVVSENVPEYTPETAPEVLPESLPDSLPESLPEAFSDENQGDSDEDGAANVVSINSGMSETPQRLTSAPEAGNGLSLPTSFSLEGMEINPSGKFVFSFSGGASISVDPGIIPFGGSRTLKFAGKELTVRADGTGFNVDVDGLSFHMPLDAA